MNRPVGAITDGLKEAPGGCTSQGERARARQRRDDTKYRRQPNVGLPGFGASHRKGNQCSQPLDGADGERELQCPHGPRTTNPEQADQGQSAAGKQRPPGAIEMRGDQDQAQSCQCEYERGTQPAT